MYGTDQERRTITVVGGGLAGMVASLELVRRGCTTALDMYGEYPVPSPAGMVPSPTPMTVLAFAR